MSDSRLAGLPSDVDLEEVERLLSLYDDAVIREQDAASEASLLADQLADTGVRAEP